MSEIHKVIVLSTAHITESDMALLEYAGEGGGSPVLCALDPYGGWGFAPDDEEQLEEVREHGFSNSMVKVLRFARRKDCRYVKFDEDGDIETDTELSIHDW